jgi:hypothetical protein
LPYGYRVSQRALGRLDTEVRQVQDVGQAAGRAVKLLKNGAAADAAHIFNPALVVDVDHAQDERCVQLRSTNRAAHTMNRHRAGPFPRMRISGDGVRPKQEISSWSARQVEY